MASPHTVSPIIGTNFAAASQTPSFKAGTMVVGNDGRTYMYVKSAGTIANAGTLAIDGTTFVGTGGAGTWDCQVPAPGVVANDYFWARKTAV